MDGMIYWCIGLCNGWFRKVSCRSPRSDPGQIINKYTDSHHTPNNEQEPKAFTFSPICLLDVAMIWLLVRSFRVMFSSCYVRLVILKASKPPSYHTNRYDFSYIIFIAYHITIQRELCPVVLCKIKRKMLVLVVHLPKRQRDRETDTETDTDHIYRFCYLCG